MIDKEILEDLFSQKRWLEKAISECNHKLDSYHKELLKVNRLIELLQTKMTEG